MPDVSQVSRQETYSSNLVNINHKRSAQSFAAALDQAQSDAGSESSLGDSGFDTAQYLENKTDQLNQIRYQGVSWTVEATGLALARAGLTPEQHYQRYGIDEGLDDKAAAAGESASAMSEEARAGTVSGGSGYYGYKTQAGTGVPLIEYYNDQGELLTSGVMTPVEILKTSYEFGIDIEGLNGLADQMDAAGVAPGNGSTGVNLRALANREMGTRHDWTTDTHQHLKPDGTKKLQEAQMLARLYGIQGAQSDLLAYDKIGYSQTLTRNDELLDQWGQTHPFGYRNHSTLDFSWMIDPSQVSAFQKA